MNMEPAFSKLHSFYSCTITVRTYVHSLSWCDVFDRAGAKGGRLDRSYAADSGCSVCGTASVTQTFPPACCDWSTAMEASIQRRPADGVRHNFQPHYYAHSSSSLVVTPSESQSVWRSPFTTPRTVAFV